MKTKRAAARQLMQELKAAYAAIDIDEPYGPDDDRTAQAIGRYYGMKRAYVLLTGRNVHDVSNEVTTWYIHTQEREDAKARHRGPEEVTEQ